MTRLLSILLLCAVSCGGQIVPPFPQPTNRPFNTNLLSPQAYTNWVNRRLALAAIGPLSTKTNILVGWKFNATADKGHIALLQSSDAVNWQFCWQGNITNLSTVLPMLNPHMFYTAVIPAYAMSANPSN